MSMPAETTAMVDSLWQSARVLPPPARVELAARILHSLQSDETAPKTKVALAEFLDGFLKSAGPLTSVYPW